MGLSDFYAYYRNEQRFPRAALDDIFAPESIVDSIGELLDYVAIKIDGPKAAGRLVLTTESATCVVIEWIAARPGGEDGGHHGRTIMRQLIEQADANTLALKAVPHGQAEGLKCFYAGYGFEESSGWIRAPRA